MFDLSRFTEMFGDLVGTAAAPASDGLLEHLAGLGFDPGQLQDMGVTELLSQLSDMGVDVSALDPGQLGEIVGQLGEGIPASDLVAQLLGDANPSG